MGFTDGHHQTRIGRIRFDRDETCLIQVQLRIGVQHDDLRNSPGSDSVGRPVTAYVQRNPLCGGSFQREFDLPRAVVQAVPSRYRGHPGCAGGDQMIENRARAQHPPALGAALGPAALVGDRHDLRDPSLGDAGGRGDVDLALRRGSAEQVRQHRYLGMRQSELGHVASMNFCQRSGKNL